MKFFAINFLTEDENYFDVTIYKDGHIEVYSNGDDGIREANSERELGLIAQLTYERAVEFVYYLVDIVKCAHFYEDDKIMFFNGSIFNLI